MFTEIDNRCGLVKVFWESVRDRIKNVEPNLVKIIDSLSPDKTFPLYLAYLPYGDLKGDTESTLIPLMNGGQVRLTDQNIPKDLIKNLSYGKATTPLGMVLEKELEYYIDLKKENITIPVAVYKPGRFFGLASNLIKNNNRIYEPNTLITASSGARSTFVLPNIGCVTKHANLQRDLNVTNPAPKSLYEHWFIFKEIINSKLIESDWKSCVLYFSQKWLEKILKDEAWLKLKTYLHEQAWRYFEYGRCRVFYDIIFSVIQKNRNLKPNPYLVDTAKHLFATAVGDAPGYAPANNENALPLELIQKAFVESYGLKKYFPTIMKPTTFIFESDKTPVYYSLQNPSTFTFSPKSRRISSTLVEMRELQNIMKIFINELLKDRMMGFDSVINEVAKQVEFNYFHNKIDRHKVVKPSHEISCFDNRFDSTNHRYKHAIASFAEDAPFVRGCVRIMKKN